MTGHRRLLIVDDEAEVRLQFHDIARTLGYEVAEAGNASQFAGVYEQFNADLVLLDLTMPSGDGIELLRKLAARNCQCGVILVSGRDKRVLATAERLGRSLGLNMHPSLQKPILRPALEQALHDAHPSARPTPDSGGVDLQFAPTRYEELRDGIDCGQLEPYFQAKVDLQAEHGFPVIGAEALARWNHPEHGLVPPDRFIPLAEELGLIGKLTEVMLNGAIAYLQSWAKEGIAMPVSVNLSPKQLTDLALPDRIADRLAQSGVAPSLLIVEVTETAKTAAFLKAVGCQSAQGFYFSRPLTSAQFEVLLSSRCAQT